MIPLKSEQRNIPGDVSENELLSVVQELNKDAAVNGILVQLPLPDHLKQSTEKIIGKTAFLFA